MRGEDGVEGAIAKVQTGSPPHARGRLLRSLIRQRIVGITPACAGKTSPSLDADLRHADHPRMRGEDSRMGKLLPEKAGSPPHARGRPASRLASTQWLGITPACAGKTPGISASSRASRDHPRMRGEDEMTDTTAWPASFEDHPRMRGEDAGKLIGTFADTGSPPHARGRQLDSPGNPAKSSSSLPVFFCS